MDMLGMQRTPSVFIDNSEFFFGISGESGTGNPPANRERVDLCELGPAHWSRPSAVPNIYTHVCVC